MRYLKTTLMAWLTVPVLALGACADSEEPTSPVPVRSVEARKVKTTTAVTTPTTKTTVATTTYSWVPVVRDMPNWEDIFDNQTIGSKGGRLTAGDITLTIPHGALKEDTNISMLTLQGDRMYVLFWPHGLQFEVPASLSFAIDKTNAKDVSSNELIGTYFENLFEEVPGVLERFGVRKGKRTASFEINHFSYYSVFVRRGYTAAGAD